jgi:hypothetical protein
MTANITTVKLVKAGSIVGNNKASGSLSTSDTDTYTTFGGSSDLWGITLTPSDVNASNFGVVIGFTGSGGDENYTTEYLKVTNFGNSVPSESTINGIEVRFDAYVKEEQIGPLGRRATAEVDHIQIKVYYTESGTPTVGTKYPLPAFKSSL